MRINFLYNFIEILVSFTVTCSWLVLLARLIVNLLANFANRR